MITPANFYSSRFCSLDEAFGHCPSSFSGPLSSLTKEKVGVKWFELINRVFPTSARILDDKKEGVGSGQWIAKNVFLTAAHNFPKSLDCYFIQPFSGPLLSMANLPIHLNTTLDYALVYIPHPSGDLETFEIASSKDISSSLAMVHQAHGSLIPQVSIGNLDSTPFFQLKPVCDIEGGPGSSGACLITDEGKWAFLHIACKNSFETLRSSLPIEDIIKDEKERFSYSFLESAPREDNFLYSTALEEPFEDETPEHGNLGLKLIPKGSLVKGLKKSEFLMAKEFVFSLIEGKLEQFYSKAFGDSGTIFSNEHYRLDIQNPATDAKNLQVQYQNQTLATVHIANDLSYFGSDKNHARGISKYILGQLINSLDYAEKNFKTMTYRIDLIKSLKK